MSAVARQFKDLDLKNKLSIAYSARRGVQPKLFYSFLTVSKLPEKNLAMLININPRTIRNYLSQKKKLDSVVSEHLLKLIALYIKGEEIFGNIDEFNYWLKKPFWKSKENPIDLLVTPGGVDIVSDELDRINYGYVV